MQNAEWPAARRQFVGARGVGEGALGNERDDRVDLRVDPIDPREMRRHDLAG